MIVADEQPVYGATTGLDVETELFNVATSAYVRVPFTVAGDPLRFDEMDLVINFDDGFIAYLNGTEVTRRNVPIESAWNSSASGSHGAVDGRIPTDVINLNDHIGLLNPGQNVLALQGMNVSVDDNDFYLLPQITAAEVQSVSQQVFVTPTPAAENNLPAAPKPTFTETGGTFVGSKTVEILNPQPSPNFQIRYTVDGTEPNEESLLYTAPLVLTRSTWLRAKVFDSSSQQAFSPSNTTSEAFIALHSDLVSRDSDVPLLVIDTLGQSFPGSGASNLASSLVSLYDVDPVTRRASIVDGNLEYSGFGGFRQRGSSTGGQPKPSLTFETWGAFDDDFDVSLLGMPSESDWVLYAPYNFDRTLIHEPFVYGLARDMGQYAPRTQVVEVYANRGGDVLDESDYLGAYVLQEKIKRGSDRVDIAAGDPEATYTDLASTPIDDPITGGYIWKIDRPDPGEPTFNAGGQGLNWVYPKHPNSTSNALKVTPAQQAYVQDFFDEFRDVLNGPDYADPVNGYAKYIDVDSWIDFHLINTLTENVDALALSTYLHKDVGGKIAFGPAWDFDRALESIDNRDDNPLDWPAGGNNLFERTWWSRLFSDPNFFQQYIDRYQELRQTEFSNEAIDARIDKWAAVVDESRVRDLERWSQTPRSNCPSPAEFCDGTWEGEVEHMRDWLHLRLGFMDGQFAPTVEFSLNDEVLTAGSEGISVDVGAALELSSPGEGLIYYTTDGTDPRGPDGLPSPSAIALNDFGEVFTGDENGKFLVPTGGASEVGWQEIGFDDSAWTSVSNRVGFDNDPSGATLVGEPGFLVRTIDVTTPLIPTINAATGILEGGPASVQSDVERVDPYVKHETASGQFDSPPGLRPPGVSGLASQFATRATAAVTIPVGTWTIAVSSDDGLRLTIPGLEYTNVVGDSRGGVLGARSDELISSAVGTKITYGTFTITDAPFETSLQLDHFNFFAGSYVELSIASGMETEFDPAVFTILQDGTMGWGVQAAEVTLNKVDYTVQIDSDVASSMLNQNSSAYLRYPITFENLSLIHI